MCRICACKVLLEVLVIKNMTRLLLWNIVTEDLLASEYKTTNTPLGKNTLPECPLPYDSIMQLIWGILNLHSLHLLPNILSLLLFEMGAIFCPSINSRES